MTHTIAALRLDAPIGRTPDGSPVYGERAFMDYVARALLERVGGTAAPTNTSLDDNFRTAQALALASAATGDARGVVHALAQRVTHLEARLCAAQRPPAASPRVEELAAITFGGRPWR